MLTERHQNSAKKCIGHPDLMTKKMLFFEIGNFFLYFSCTCATGVCVYMNAKLCFYLFSWS